MRWGEIARACRTMAGGFAEPGRDRWHPRRRPSRRKRSPRPNGGGFVRFLRFLRITASRSSVRPRGPLRLLERGPARDPQNPQKRGPSAERRHLLRVLGVSGPALVARGRDRREPPALLQGVAGDGERRRGTPIRAEGERPILRSRMAFVGEIVRADRIVHGQTSPIHRGFRGIYRGRRNHRESSADRPGPPIISSHASGFRRQGRHGETTRATRTLQGRLVPFRGYCKKSGDAGEKVKVRRVTRSPPPSRGDAVPIPKPMKQERLENGTAAEDRPLRFDRP
jgi:hypothetical protein